MVRTVPPVRRAGDIGDGLLLMNPPSHPHRSRRFLEVAAVAVIYYAAARLSLLLAFERTNASPVWPPSGIAFAAVLLLGSRIWPGVLLGAFIANVQVFLANRSADVSTILLVSSCMALGNTLEALTGRWLLRRSGVAGDPLDNLQETFKFVAAAFLMCLVSSSIGPTALELAGMAAWSLYGTIWFTWWLGDTAGVLVVTPLILSWARQPIVRWTVRQRLEILCLTFTLILCGRIALAGWLLPAGAGYPLSYLIIPPLMWATVRFGQREAIAAVVLTSAVAIWGASHGTGPFARDTVNEALLLLQAFIGVVTVTILAMAASLCERRKAQESLRAINESLKARASELSRSNSDLEQFAYVASHDLQEPLRMVTSYVQLLQSRYKGRLDERADQYILHAAGGAQRMQQLIQDLLVYSRIGRSEERLQLVDCAMPLAAALSNLRLTIEETSAEIRYDALPTVMADPSQLMQLFQNLLENSLKFRSEALPTVRVSAAREAEEWIISVQDNGIGIEPRHSERIFQVFKRLHGMESYPGTGIGLAIARKIVDRHRGRIWVESEPGKGSTFLVALPVPRDGEVAG